MVPFSRSPRPRGRACELAVNVGGATISGLHAPPAEGAPTRALLVAIHGAGVHAGYFDAPAAPDELSLLTMGSRAGFAVWAPDRPGIGASADLPDKRVRLFAQAELLLDAIDVFAHEHDIGRGVLLVGHSYGLKVAWVMASTARGAALLGVDGAASGIRSAFDWGDPSARRSPDRATGYRGASWGAEAIYPPATFERRNLPVHPMPAAQRSESARWPDDLRAIGKRIRVPLRLTYGEHEELWPIDGTHFAELRAALPNAPLVIEVEANAGHNISLGYAARTYHAKVIQFAERLLAMDACKAP